jgi:hypothetical protein
MSFLAARGFRRHPSRQQAFIKEIKRTAPMRWGLGQLCGFRKAQACDDG